MSTFKTTMLKSEFSSRTKQGIARAKRERWEQATMMKLVITQFIICSVLIAFNGYQANSVKPVEAYVIPKQYPEYVTSELQREAYDIMVARGLSKSDRATAFKIIQCESSWRPSAYHSQVHKSGVLSTDRGLAMINDFYHKEVSDDCAFNATCAVNAMIDIAKANNGWNAWACYNLIK